MSRSTGIGRVALLVAGGLLFVLSAVAVGESAVTPGSKAAKMDACVAATDDMRRNHMDYLTHDRIETVRKGVRDTQYSLAECVNCHAEADAEGGHKAINSEGQFCDSCHEYVAVNLTCFQCHSKKPEQKTGTLRQMESAILKQGVDIGSLPATDGKQLRNHDLYTRLHATTPEE